MDKSPAYIVGILFGQLMIRIIGSAVASLLIALIIQGAVRWVAKFEAPYWKCYLAHFSASAVSMIAGAFFGLVVGVAGLPILMAYVPAILIGFLALALAYWLLIRGPAGERLTFGKSLLVVACVVGVTLGIALLLALVLALVL